VPASLKQKAVNQLVMSLAMRREHLAALILTSCSRDAVPNPEFRRFMTNDGAFIVCASTGVEVADKKPRSCWQNALVTDPICESSIANVG
jgi:hypothetical protein